ncbi:MAG TPA: GT-D fold domain-containing glycosyltransferase [Candidatus Paceibacterota bacterium]|nr:GT-D fold domain-containing glycosyltransferase [Candidatus Paceibacterota bacterium]
MASFIKIWNNRVQKFLDNPVALIPFLKKRLYYDFIADRYLPAYKDFTYVGYQETIDRAIEGNMSLVRFGDELFDMIHGIGLYFGDWRQRYRPELARRLEEVISSKDPRLLICFNPELILKTKREFIEAGIGEQYQFWTNSKVYLKDYYHPDVVYGSALCFHPRYNTDINYKKLNSYFRTKHIVVVTSGTERFKDLSLGKTTTLIEAPKSDAWDHYSSILEKVRNQALSFKVAPAEILILVSMGSAAKVLAYDLMLEGYVAWDTGQFFDLAAKEIRQTKEQFL